jgi:hypothetical protein
VLFATFGLQYIGTAIGDWARAAAAARRHSEDVAGRQQTMERQREGLAQQALVRKQRLQQQEGVEGEFSAPRGGGGGGGHGGRAGGGDAHGVTWGEQGRAAEEDAGAPQPQPQPRPAAAALESGLYDFYSTVPGSGSQGGDRSGAPGRPGPAATGAAGAARGWGAALGQDHEQARWRGDNLLLYSSEGFYRASVWSRLVLAAAFTLLFLLGHCERGLLLLAAVNAAGALSMAAALRRQYFMHSGLA